MLKGQMIRNFFPGYLPIKVARGKKSPLLENVCFCLQQQSSPKGLFVEAKGLHILSSPPPFSYLFSPIDPPNFRGTLVINVNIF